jgi:hypothetical protein
VGGVLIHVRAPAARARRRRDLVIDGRGRWAAVEGHGSICRGRTRSNGAARRQAVCGTAVTGRNGSIHGASTRSSVRRSLLRRPALSLTGSVSPVTAGKDTAASARRVWCCVWCPAACLRSQRGHRGGGGRAGVRRTRSSSRPLRAAALGVGTRRLGCRHVRSRDAHAAAASTRDPRRVLPSESHQARRAASPAASESAGSPHVRRPVKSAPAAAPPAHAVALPLSTMSGARQPAHGGTCWPRPTAGGTSAGQPPQLTSSTTRPRRGKRRRRRAWCRRVAAVVREQHEDLAALLQPPTRRAAVRRAAAAARSSALCRGWCAAARQSQDARQTSKAIRWEAAHTIRGLQTGNCSHTLIVNPLIRKAAIRRLRRVLARLGACENCRRYRCRRTGATVAAAPARPRGLPPSTRPATVGS